jgi:hypothetical protein
VTVAVSDRNARRSDEAERTRHISASDSVAFATMLLGLLNDADTVLHRMEHQPESRAAEPAASRPHPTATAPAGLAPADPGPGHEEQHAGTIETPAADLSPVIHADATATIQPQDASATLDDTPSGEVLATHTFASSPALSSFSASVDHAPSAGESNLHGGSTASSPFDFGASIHNLADTVTGIVDTTLATVSSTIASLSATVGQLTSTLSGTVSHLADGLTGAVTGLIHDAPVTGVLEPLVTDVLGSTPTIATDFSDAAHHGASLLDTAGAIPTTLLHPLPLQLGFLGQPTIDGHDMHDGAFSALGVHHF